MSIAASEGLPAGWNLSTMGKVGRYLNGYAFSSKTWGTTGRPIIRIQNLTGSGSEFNYFSGNIEPRYVVQPGDLLFSWAATLGVYVWSGPEAVLNQHIFKVESLLNRGFHRYLIEASLDEMKSKTHGTGMVHITKKKFDEIVVAVPPDGEQEEIVQILEEQFSRLDAAAASIAAVRRKADQFRRALLRTAFDGSLNICSKDDSGIESMSRWSTESLRQVSSGGLFVDGDWVESKDQDPSGQIRLTQLADVGVGVFRDKSDRWLRADQASRLGVTFLEEGDLLIARMPDPLGRSCLVPKLPSAAVTVVDVAVLRIARADVDGRFVMWALNSPRVRDAMTMVASGTTRLRISRKKLESIEIPVPALEEQIMVVDTLEQQFSRLERSLAVADETERKVSALRRSLLHAAFSGELTKEWREKNNG